MHPIRPGQETFHLPSGLRLLALMLVVGLSCGPTSGTRDRPPATPSADVLAVAEDNSCSSWR
jgi:hypothetical protein